MHGTSPYTYGPKYALVWNIITLVYASMSISKAKLFNKLSQSVCESVFHSVKAFSHVQKFQQCACYSSIEEI